MVIIFLVNKSARNVSLRDHFWRHSYHKTLLFYSKLLYALQWSTKKKFGS